MSFNLLAESENYLSWDTAFRLLSLEQCLPFFELMGLSPSLSKHPSEIILISRNFLEQGYVHKAGYKSSLNYRQENLVEAFIKIEKVYGANVTQHFHDWCIKYIVDDQISSSWYAWGTLFHYLCNPSDKVALSELIPPSTQTRICSCIMLDQYQETMEEFDEHLSLARLAPLSEWEAWLEQKIQDSIGDDEVVSLIEFVLTDIKSVVGYHQTAKIWEHLVNVLLPNEQQILIDWAHWQAEELGIPDDLVDLAPLRAK